MIIFIIAFACSFAMIILGGGLYEFLVVDPSWPKRPDLIQPAQGGINRKRFWIPAHATFELMLIAALIMAWSLADVRFWLWVALMSHAIMRIWSAFDFIPKALAFERADASTITESAARAWTRRSLLRFPLDLVTSSAMIAALIATVRLV
jgi:hypothetical protein